MDPSDRYHAAPLENDMFEWHFTIKGADKTDFEGGVYHGRILLPAEYPFKPPNIIFLTPNGRFQTNMKVCLSFSAYHPELWQPAWGIRLILEALISFLPTKGDGAVGALDWTSAERKRLAKESSKFNCPLCGSCVQIMKSLENRIQESDAKRNKSHNFKEEIEKLHAFQEAAEGSRRNEDIKCEGLTNINNGDSCKNTSDKPKRLREEEKIVADNGKGLNVKNLDEKPIPNDKDLDVGVVTFLPNKMETEPLGSQRSEEEQKKEVVQCEKNETQDDVSAEDISEGENNDDGGQLENDLNNQNNIAEIPFLDQLILDSPWFSDSVLNSAIVVLALVLFLLFHKLNGLVTELRVVEKEFISL